MPIINAKYKQSKLKTVSDIPVVYGATTSDIDNSYVISYNTNVLDPSIHFRSGTVNQALDKMNTVNSDFIIGYDNNTSCAVAVANGKLLSSNIVNIIELNKEQDGIVEKFLSICRVDKDNKTLKNVDVQITQNKDILDIQNNISDVNNARTKDSSAKGQDTSKYISVYVHAKAGVLDDVSVITNNIASARTLSQLQIDVTNISTKLDKLATESLDKSTTHTIYEQKQYGTTFNNEYNIQFNIEQGESGKILDDPKITVNYATINGEGIIAPGIATDVFVSSVYDYKYNNVVKPLIDRLNSSVNKNENSIKTINSSIANINSSISNVKSSISTINTSISNINSSINRINSSINNINSSIVNVKSSISTINSSIANINSSINNVKSSINTINSSVNSNKTSIDSLSNSITTINNKITTINSSISTDKTNITSLTNRIKAIEDLNLKDGESAGFGTVSAKIGTNNPDQSPSVTIAASGPNTAKNFEFTFNNIKGKDAEVQGEATSDDYGLVKIGYNYGYSMVKDSSVYVPVKLDSGKMYVELSAAQLLQNDMGAYNRPIVLFAGRIYKLTNSTSWLSSGAQAYGISSMPITINNGLMTVKLSMFSGYSINVYSISVTQRNSPQSGSDNTDTDIGGRGQGAHWFEAYPDSYTNTTAIYIREFHQGDQNNNTWTSNSWGGDYAVSDINVIMVGYITKS